MEPAKPAIIQEICGSSPMLPPEILTPKLLTDNRVRRSARARRSSRSRSLSRSSRPFMRNRAIRGRRMDGLPPDWLLEHCAPNQKLDSRELSKGYPQTIHRDVPS